jgi:hypothetical protein
VGWGAGKNKIPVLLSEVKSNNTDGTWSGDTYSYSGVTFKVDSNSEGYVTKITVNASPSSSAFSFYLKRENITYTNNMILNGCPSGGGDATYDLRVTGGYRDIGSGVTIPANTSFNVFWIVIRSGITVSNLVFQPMIRLSTESDPTFAPYSNICPITAYTEGEIEVRGRNLCYAVVTGRALTTVASGYSFISANGTCLMARVKAGRTHYFNNVPNANRKIIAIFPNEPNINDTTNISYTSSAFTPSIDGYAVIYVSNTNLSVDEPMVAESDTPVRYEPYTSTTNTAQFSESIYQGEMDFVGENVECYVRMLTFDGSESWLSIGDTDKQYFYLSLGETQLFVDDDAICSHYINDSSISISNRNIGIRVFYSTTNVSQRIIVRPVGFDSMSVVDFCQYLYGLQNDGNPLQITVRLIATTNDPITPTNLPIKSLFGYNHIESTTGDMEVEYITGEYQPLVDLIQSSKHVYSTAEQIVGMWIDGSTIYEKTIVFPTPVSVSTTFKSCGIDSTNILNVVGVFGTHEDGTGYGDMMADPGLTSHTLLGLKASTSHTVKTLTLQYTKATT